MKKNNKLDKTFGPMAFAGVILFLPIMAVVCMLFFKLVHELIFNGFNGLRIEISDILPFVFVVFIFLFTAFIGFTATCTRIDYKNKRMKYTTRLFGVIPIGKWTYLTPDMKLGLKETTEIWGAYSRSNRSTSLDYNDLKIFLYDSEYTEIIPVKKVKKAKNAEAELEKLSNLLNLDIIE